jgi:FkbM family methyltransferase
MARWAGETGRVYAFEPAPEPLQALRDHVTLNELADRIEVIGQAVSDVCGEATFYAHTSSGENSLNAEHAKRVLAAEAVRVEVTTIDDFCRQGEIRPTLIKIDIEGFEFHALRGAAETISKYRPIIIIELHPHIWPEIGLSRTDAELVLNELNYRAVPLDGQTDPLVEFGHVALELIS